MRKSFAHILLMSFALVFVRAEEDKKEDPAEEFRKEIKPILQKHCYDCHDADVQKGDLNLAQYEELDQVKGAPELWQIVYERVHAFEMPPKGKKDLSFDKQRKMVQFLRGLPRPEDVAADLALANQPEPEPVRPRPRPLTPAPIKAVTETGAFGPLPRIAKDGRKPFDVYARPLPASPIGGARIAIVLGVAIYHWLKRRLGGATAMAPDEARRALVRYSVLVDEDRDEAVHAARIADLSMQLNDATTAAAWYQKSDALRPSDASLLARMADAQAAWDAWRTERLIG